MVFDPSKITNEVRLVQTYSGDEFMEKVCRKQGVSIVGTPKLYADLRRSYSLRNLYRQKKSVGVPVLVKGFDYDKDLESFHLDDGRGMFAYLGSAESGSMIDEGKVFLSDWITNKVGYRDYLWILMPSLPDFNSEFQELLR